MKKFFKFLLLGAFTLSLGVSFTGCNDWGDEIDEICTQIDGINSKIADLEKEIVKADKYITEMTVSGYVLTAKYTDGTSIKVTLPEGPEGAKMPYYEVNTEKGGYDLWVYAKDGSTLQKIYIPGPSSATTKIELLGWLDGYVKDTDTAKTPISKAELAGNNGNPFIVSYSYVSAFAFNHNPAATDGVTDNVPYTDPTPDWTEKWAGGGKQVLLGSVTNTLAADRQGFVVQVFPSNANISETAFTVENSQGVVVPISFGTPELIGGLLTTRAAESSALYFLPGDKTNEIYTTASGKTIGNDYIMKFVDEAVYSLVADGVYRTNYSEFTMESQPVTSKEGGVSGIIAYADKKAPEDLTATPDVAIASSPMKVVSGRQYAVTFATPITTTGTPNNTSTTPYTPGTAATTTAVIDYYLETTIGIDETLFKVGFNDTKTAFTVTLLADNISLVTFDLNVYKLGVDGKIYLETITILPERKVINTLIELGKILIKNTNPVVNYMMPSVIVPLDKMFNEINAESFANGVNLGDFWRSARGAYTYKITKLVIDGNTYNATDAAMYFTTIDNAGGAINANTKSDGSGTDLTNLVGGSGEMNQARSLVIPTPYAETTGDLVGLGTATAPSPGKGVYPAGASPYPTFLLEKQYEVTIEFVDASDQHNVINSITYTYTPTIPDLSSLFEISSAFWTPAAKTGTLQAYYKEPATWAAGEAPNKETYDVAVGLYSGNAMVGAGGNGGFTSFTDGVTWGLAPKQFMNGPSDVTSTYVSYAQSSITPANDMIFTLKGQYLPAGITQPTGVDFAGNGVVGPTPTTVAVATDIVRILDPNNAALKQANEATYSAYLNGYKKELSVVPTAIAPYLGVYAYDATALAGADKFKIQIMSELYEGTVRGTAGKAIDLVPVGNLDTIKDADIEGFKYNSVVPYSVFQVWDANKPGGAGPVYAYKYIDKVEFYAYRVNTSGARIVEDRYTIVASDGTTPTNVATAPTANTASVLYVSPNSTTNEVVAWDGTDADTNGASILVRVFDRFGKVKEARIPLHIAKAVPPGK